MGLQHADVKRFLAGWKSAFAKHKWRTTLLVLAIFAVSAISIIGKSYLSALGIKLAKTEEQLQAVSNKLTRMELHIFNSITVTNIINNITKIEKELAGMQEAIRDFHNYARKEVFGKHDLERRIKIFSTNGVTCVYFELDHIPWPESVKIYNARSDFFAPQTFNCNWNIIELRLKGDSDQSLQTKDDFYCIKYHRNPYNEEPLRTIQDMRFDGIDGIVKINGFENLWSHFRLKLKPPEKVGINAPIQK